MVPKLIFQNKDDEIFTVDETGSGISKIDSVDADENHDNVFEDPIPITIPSNMEGCFHVLQKATLFNSFIWQQFVDDEVTDMVLEAMSHDDVKMLFPKFGNLVLFEKERKLWMQNKKVYISESDITDSDIANTDPFHDMVIDYEDEIFDIETILRDLLQSSIVLKTYKEDQDKYNMHRPLTRSERKTVCNTLMDYAVNNRVLLRRCDFPKIVSKILIIFKKEPASLYYKPPSKNKKKKIVEQNENASNKQADRSNKKSRNKGPSGILYTAYRYRISKKRAEMRRLKKSLNGYYRNDMGTSKTHSDIELDENIDINADENEKLQVWLQYNYDGWDTIKKYWSKSCIFRRSQILSKDKTFFDILDLWPRYRKKEGFELVDIDFEHLYPLSADNLKHHWHRYTAKILQLAFDEAIRTRDKDRQIVFKSKSQNPNDDHNFYGVLALNALFYLCPNYDRSVQQHLDKLIKKAPKGTMINEEIQRICR
ncbi:hypothetical protein ACFFRR_003059 [Megaselia abdita]